LIAAAIYIPPAGAFGGAELFLEFGFVRLRLQTYARGKSKLTLSAYEIEGRGPKPWLWPMLSWPASGGDRDDAARRSSRRRQDSRLGTADARALRPDGKTFTRLMVPYPSSDVAAAALAHIKANLDSYLKVTNDRPDGLDFVDFQGKKGTIVRSGALLETRFKITD
jgi:hypothetical protein